MGIQAILLSKKRFSRGQAEEWIYTHNFHPIKEVHETQHKWRFRLEVPNEQKYKYRTFHINPFIEYIIEYPKHE